MLQQLEFTFLSEHSHVSCADLDCELSCFQVWMLWCSSHQLFDPALVLQLGTWTMLTQATSPESRNGFPLFPHIFRGIGIAFYRHGICIPWTILFGIGRVIKARALPEGKRSSSLFRTLTVVARSGQFCTVSWETARQTPREGDQS